VPSYGHLNLKDDLENMSELFGLAPNVEGEVRDVRRGTPCASHRTSRAASRRGRMGSSCSR
jgi:hypothetical protein